MSKIWGKNLIVIAAAILLAAFAACAAVGGVYVSAYRDGGRATYAVSNLTREKKTVTLPVAGLASAKEMISGKSIPADGGRITLDLEPFTPCLLD